MAGLNIQTADHTVRFVEDTTLVPSACHSLSGGSSNPPKFGTLIPNRIFVGGIPSNTVEHELKSFFSSFGQVKDVKIISDRLGVSKGSYGFVTFESQEMAEKIIKNESETLIFKDRKLNIGHAIRKQQMFPRSDLPATLFFTGGAMPYGLQNGMAVFPLPGQEYPMLAQAAAPYATMMLSQPGNGTALYLPQSLHSAASATASYAQISQQVNAAIQQQQYQHHTGAASGLPSVAGPLTQATANATNVQSGSTAAVMAAAAAMAAAVQWPQQVTQTNSHQQGSQHLGTASLHGSGHTVGAQQGLTQSPAFTPQQAVAMAAVAAAQQQAGWRWSPSVQQAQHSHATSSSNISASGITTTISSTLGGNSSTPAVSNQAVHAQQQGSPTTPLGPPTYLYSPIAGTGHELMFFHQTSSPYAANSTSDYSTDHNSHSSGMLESIEQMSFPCDGTPLGRHSQQLSGAFGAQQLDGACLSSYATFAPLLDLQSHNGGVGHQSTLISPSLQQFRQAHQSTAAVLAATGPASAQHIVPIANNVPVVSQPHIKLYSPGSLPSLNNVNTSSNGVSTFQLPTNIYGNSSIKMTNLSDLNASNDMVASSMNQTSNIQSTTLSPGGVPMNVSSVAGHNSSLAQLQATSGNASS